MVHSLAGRLQSRRRHGKGRVKAKGPVNNILKLVPLCKPLSPVYREMIAEKDAAAV
jgi:hypothetical protein